MTYPEVLANARTCIGQYCKACPVCNGVACKNQIPGPGAKGVGDTAIRNYNKWADIRVNMDTLCPGGAPDTTLELFGKSFRYPFFAGPVGAVNLHYSDTYTAMTYNDVLVRACAENGIAAFTGDGTNPTVMEMATRAIGAAGGCGVPTIKPWNIDTIREKMAQAKASGCFAVAMDVDAAGLPFLKNMTPPAGSKSVEELTEIVQLAERPFIVKGVMTVKGALKAKQAGAAAIVVSNHGGRVLDQCPATAEVLPEIAAALKGTGVKVLVDGGIRTGVDVFKALALGADGVLICRPFVTAVYGGGEEGVKCYIDKLAGEMADNMQMCGANSIAEIKPDIIVADIMMPKMDGFTMVKLIRKTDTHTPVLFLSARSAANDVVEGFETGGNDYLKNPFGMAELIVRIKALLHKVSVQRPEATSFRIGLYTFDSITQTLVYRGEKQLLSNRESEILKRLCDNKDQVLPMKGI